MDEKGSADVTMTVQLRVEEVVDVLYFPLPANAENVKLNNGGASTSTSGNATQVKIDGKLINTQGLSVITLQFRLSNVVKMVDGKLTLEMPLLSGFLYPVSGVSLTVMLPGTIQANPVFKSTYHQQDISSILNVTVSGNLITGLITQQLKDRETLSMTMEADPEMFPGVSTYVRVGNPEVIPMLICAGLALVYWLLFLRGYPLLKERRNAPLEGLTAGEMGARLTLSGTDLTATVFSWAQMGYLLIQLDDRGRVWLQKRMDMGNERSPFEVKFFRQLFARRDVVDATGMHYASLAKKAASINPGSKTLRHPKCGNANIFRGLLCLMQLLCGVCYAMNFVNVLALQVLLSIFLGALGGVSAWLMQRGMYHIHLRSRGAVYLSLGLGAGWLLLGLWCGQWLIGLGSLTAQLLGGLMAAYGGRRSQLGRLNASQILGLRRYLKTVERAELKRIQENDPEYFYNLLPVALALGVDMAFARRFDKKKLGQCPYFSCGIRERMTAAEWIRFFRETARIMDERYKRMELEAYAPIWLRR